MRNSEVAGGHPSYLGQRLSRYPTNAPTKLLIVAVTAYLANSSLFFTKNVLEFRLVSRVIPVAAGGSKGGIRMWPSEHWASRLYDVANVALIAGLIIGAASTVLVV